MPNGINKNTGNFGTLSDNSGINNNRQMSPVGSSIPSSGGYMGHDLGLRGRLEPSNYQYDPNSTSFYSNNTSNISNNLSNSRYMIRRDVIIDNPGYNKGKLASIGKVIPN